ncbi:hypothetical protein A9K71_10115 [Mesorhizobium sp. WSM3873]|nr:hypothetical protein A9K71_10115 [Mesorhizobium sp. WSM3873]
MPVQLEKDDSIPDLLAEAWDCESANGPAWAEAHLASWSDAYVVPGAKPNCTSCFIAGCRFRSSERIHGRRGIRRDRSIGIIKG